MRSWCSKRTPFWEANPGFDSGKVAVSYFVSESAGMMEHRAQDDSHTPYESAGMVEPDQTRVMTPLGS